MITFEVLTESQNYFLQQKDYTDDIRIDALLGGSKWGDQVNTGARITYSFPTQSGWDNPDVWRGYGGNNHPEPWTAAFGTLDEVPDGQNYFTQALEAWEEVANITFTEVADIPDVPGDAQVTPGVIRVAYASLRGEAGHASYPSSSVRGGDIWLDGDFETFSHDHLAPGSGGFEVLLHETGHALGLKHPRNYEDAASYENELPKDDDNTLNTVMSYVGAAEQVKAGNLALTPMPFDILALQHLYGVNRNTRAGDTHYLFDNEDLRLGTNLQLVRYDLGRQTIWDGGGQDSFNASQVGADSVINLKEGAASSIGGKTNNVFIAFGAKIENAVGGTGQDTLIGNDISNFLSGGDGADTSSGGRGDDYLYGDGGQDDLKGGNGDDYLSGGAQGDTLEGGPGADTLDGGDGKDTVDYSDNEMFFGLALGMDIGYFDHWAVIYSMGGHLTVDLAEGQASFALRGRSNGGGAVAWAYTEPLMNIEDVIGTSGDDVVNGNELANVIAGGPGIDTLDGRGGSDTVSYEGVEEFVWLDLAGETATLTRTSITSDGPKEISYTETFKNFENAIAGAGGSRIFGSDVPNRLTGGARTDRLIGLEANDTLEGGDGNDFLYGGYAASSPDNAGLDDGDDHLDGGPGDDVIDGGTGDDWAYYDDSDGELRLDLAAGQAMIYEKRINPADGSVRDVAYYDRLVDIENIVGSGGVNWIHGTNENNNLSGGPADDHLFGRAGNDRLGGGEGTDELYGEAEEDHLTGGPASDKIYGGAGIDTVDYSDNEVLIYSPFGYPASQPAIVLHGTLTLDLYAGTAAIAQIVQGLNPATGEYGIFTNFYGEDIDGVENAVGTSLSDTIKGSEQRNILEGLGGNDTYIVDDVDDVIVELANEGIDTVKTEWIYFLPEHVENFEAIDTDQRQVQGVGNDLGNEMKANNTSTMLFGSGGTDKLFGGGASDGLAGGAGTDTILGGGGPDKVYGNEDDDRLDGGDGNDILTGGAGADTFVFLGNHKIDSIRDFDVTADHLKIAGGFSALELFDGTFDGILDGNDANVSFGVPTKNDTYIPFYDGPPDEADSYGMNVVTGGGLIHLDNVFALTPDDVWALV